MSESNSSERPPASGGQQEQAAFCKLISLWVEPLCESNLFVSRTSLGKSPLSAEHVQHCTVEWQLPSRDAHGKWVEENKWALSNEFRLKGFRSKASDQKGLDRKAADRKGSRSKRFRSNGRSLLSRIIRLEKSLFFYHYRKKLFAYPFRCCNLVAIFRCFVYLTGFQVLASWRVRERRSPVWL